MEAPMLKKVNHVAYRVRDAAKTIEFYSKGLGLDYKGLSSFESVPSIGFEKPHAHMIFKLPDGGTLDFFEILDGVTQLTPTDRDIAQHLAFEVENVDEAEEIAGRLRAMGTEVKGPIPHPLGTSYYFYDPSGHRLEMVTLADPKIEQAVWDRMGPMAGAQLARWEERKKQPVT
jgi:catechol 2,3-dioxygenase-like lactoylglutathione lyase family enzyme